MTEPSRGQSGLIQAILRPTAKYAAENDSIGNQGLLCFGASRYSPDGDSFVISFNVTDRTPESKRKSRLRDGKGGLLCGANCISGYDCQESPAHARGCDFAFRCLRNSFFFSVDVLSLIDVESGYYALDARVLSTNDHAQQNQ